MRTVCYLASLITEAMLWQAVQAIQLQAFIQQTLRAVVASICCNQFRPLYQPSMLEKNIKRYCCLLIIPASACYVHHSCHCTHKKRPHTQNRPHHRETRFRSPHTSLQHSPVLFLICRSLPSSQGHRNKPTNRPSLRPRIQFTANSLAADTVCPKPLKPHPPSPTLSGYTLIAQLPDMATPFTRGPCWPPSSSRQPSW